MSPSGRLRVTLSLLLLSLGTALPSAQPPSRPPAWTLPAGDAWPRCTAAEAGFDRVRLDEAVAYARSHETPRPRDFSDQARIFGEPLGPLPPSRGGTNGLILRRGCLAAEFGETAAVEPVYSAAKSFLSTVLGVAVDRGLIRDVHDRVAEYVTDGGYDSPQNAAITWHHHAQQTSEWEGALWGRRHDFVGRAGFGEGERAPRALEPPGRHYEYNDVRINRFALSLLRVWKKPLVDVLRDEVMAPIGASDSWRWVPYENAWADVDGRRMPSVSGGTRWGGGIWMSSRDAARFGLLFLNRGRWGARQIVSEGWVEAATTPGPLKDDYGYLWWLNTGRRLWPDGSERAFAAIGFGSNTIFIDPADDLVIVWRWHEGNGAAFFGLVSKAIANR